MINLNYFMARHITNFKLPIARYVSLKWPRTKRAAFRRLTKLAMPYAYGFGWCVGHSKLGNQTPG